MRKPIRDRKKTIFSFNLFYNLSRKESVGASKDFEERFFQYIKDARIHDKSDYIRKLIDKRLKKQGVKEIRELLLITQRDRELKEFETIINNSLIDWFKVKNLSELIVKFCEEDMENFYKKRGKNGEGI